MTEFIERGLEKISRTPIRDNMSSGVSSKRAGKPQVELYRPGSGPLKKSAYGEEDFYGEQAHSKNERRNFGRDKKEIVDYCRNDPVKLSEDFDRLSVCSSSSRKNERSSNQHFSGSVGDLNDIRRRPKKPEAAIYVHPKSSSPMQTDNENKRYKSKNNSNSQRGDKLKQDNDQFKRDPHPDSFKRDNETPKKDVGYQLSDSRSLRDESQHSRRQNDRPQKYKKSKRRNVRREIKEDNNEGKIVPSMEIKHNIGSLTGRINNYDAAGHETSGYTTTDGESERDPYPPSMRGGYVQPNRGLRQASEPRSLPLNSVQAENITRDSRSVEPDDDHLWSQDRFNQKPPMNSFGRRGSRQSHSKHKQHNQFDMLPPRLQRKFMEENRLQDPPINSGYSTSNTEKPYLGSNPDLSYHGTDSEPNYSGPVSKSSYLMTDSKSKYLNSNVTFIGTNSEDPWDGSCSVTFQGSNSNAFFPNVPVLSQPPPNVYSQIPPPSLWSQTLPNIKARGRGRVPHHELERERIAFEEARMTRSLTPNTFGGCTSQEEPISLQIEEGVLENEKKEESISAKSLEKNASLTPEPNQNKTDEIQMNENNTSISKQKSPVPPQSPQELTFKKTSGTGMNWADEVELSERLQETLEEKESEDNTYSFSNNNSSPVSQPIISSHKERQRRRKRSVSRDRHHTGDRRRRSVDVEERQMPMSRSRHNSGEDRSYVSRSRKNSGDDRNWSRSRKNSGDDRNWRRDENRDPYDNHRSHSRNNSRSNSQNNSRNNSVERWTNEEYHRFNGSEWKFRGNGGEQFRGNGGEQSRRGGVKNYNTLPDRHFNNPSRRRGSRDYNSDCQKEQPKQEENWREEARRLNGPGPTTDVKKQQKPAGILVLPPSVSPQKETETSSNKQSRNVQTFHTQKQLFDPSNPHKPLIVNTPADSGRVAGCPGQQNTSQEGQFAVPMAPPIHMIHNPILMKEAEFIDFELSHMMSTYSWYEYHDVISKKRARLQEILWILLTSDIKYCEQENMEFYFWKVLYHNLLEWLRNQMGAAPQNREIFLSIIDEGVEYFENTLRMLEDTYKFRYEEYLTVGMSPAKGKPLLTLALHAVQKVLLFMGDLARYRETVQDNPNYGVARQWYMKAQQLNPKNGRPYYQLAILAVYARRVLDSVYYYMRSLIAAISVASAKENLLTLFDENRKKYEISEKQRQEERDLRNKEKMKEKEFEGKKSMQLRREIWIHPEGGRRVHRTTSTSQVGLDDSEAELEAMSHTDLSKRFSMSFLHVHGKLFTKVGMESFNGVAVQMLREFRVLLQHSPLPLNSTRLLQLLAINMFAIDNTQLKTSELGPGYRSVLQEAALVTSLQMFNMLLERAVLLLKDQQNHGLTYKLVVNEDVNNLLPAIKVWCDWLLCHSAVWNPPPSCHDYQVGSAGDVWGKLAALVNLLDKLDHPQHLLSEKCIDSYVQVRLPEDASLAGFLPLSFHCADPMYTSKDTNMEMAQVCLRIQRILFCGTVFLCGVDPPVLKLHKDESGASEYISVVETPSPPAQSDGELCVESVSGENSEDSGQASEDEGSLVNSGGSEIQSLLQRKQELERSHRRQEKRQQKVQNILQRSMVSVEIEVRPHYLVADTNCFIDYLPQLQVIARSSSPSRPHLYTLMVPLVVLNELDGLAHGRRDSSARPEHLAMVTECAASALEFLRGRVTPAVRCVTTKGTILNSTTFTSEEDCQDLSNDDKILTTCLKLCHSSNKEQIEGEPRKICRDVVLLTEDRNLRVKALARDVPVREVPDFLQWAGLGPG